MADAELNLAANQPCDQNMDAVQALAIIPFSRDDIRREYVNFDTPPDHTNPVAVISKVRDMLPSRLEADRLVAVSLHMFCTRRRHTGEPRRDHRRLRLELLGSYILADDEARVLSIQQSSSGGLRRSRRGNNLYAATDYGEELDKTIYLPYAEYLRGSPPIVGAIEARRRSGPLYVAMRGIEHVVFKSQMPQVPGHPPTI
jgi:hypothetical protein